MGFFDRIKENSRRLREQNRQQLNKADAKLARFTDRKLHITTDDDTVPAVARQMHFTVDPLRPASPKPPSAADIANRNRRAEEEQKRNRKPKVSVEDVPTRGGRGADIGAAATQSMRASASAPKPVAKAKPKGPSEMENFMAGYEGNAVARKIKERAAKGEKGLSSDNQFAEKLRKFGFAKGGHVKANGIARKGKTRGRII